MGHGTCVMWGTCKAGAWLCFGPHHWVTLLSTATWGSYNTKAVKPHRTIWETLAQRELSVIQEFLSTYCSAAFISLVWRMIPSPSSSLGQSRFYNKNPFFKISNNWRYALQKWHSQLHNQESTRGFVYFLQHCPKHKVTNRFCVGIVTIGMWSIIGNRTFTSADFL